MAWFYNSTTGRLSRDGRSVSQGYSGNDIGQDNPEYEAVQNVGPIPRGAYLIGRPRHSGETGPHVLDLTPYGHNAHNRTNFQIHGDNESMDRSASEGCIVLPRSIRETISNSEDNELVVE